MGDFKYVVLFVFVFIATDLLKEFIYFFVQNQVKFICKKWKA